MEDPKLAQKSTEEQPVEVMMPIAHDGNKATLRTQILEELETKGGKYALLARILRKNKTLKVKFHKPINSGLEEAFVVMIHGVNDTHLMRLGREHGFSRGMIIFWVPEKQINIGGFYPKFTNDDHATPSKIDTSTLKTFQIKGKKYSGYLFHAIAVKYGGKVYALFCSKNSANRKTAADQQPFISGGIEIFIKSHPNWEDVFRKMATDHLYIGGEMVGAPFDRCHGYHGKKPLFTLTCMGECTVSSATDTCEPTGKNNWIEHFPWPKIQEFARDFSLFVGHSWTFTGNAAKMAYKLLNEHRDFLTNRGLDQVIGLVQKAVEEGTCSGTVVISEGTIDHRDVDDMVLEGLIICINGGDREKWKLMIYAIRTFTLRRILNKFQWRGINPAVLLSRTVADIIHESVDHWTVTREGYDFWYKFACCALYLLYSKAEVPLESLEKPHRTADHIVVSDTLINMLKWEDTAPIAALDALYKKFLAAREESSTIFRENANATCICVVGPVGAGKTTSARVLAAKLTAQKRAELCAKLTEIIGDKTAQAVMAIIEPYIKIYHIDGDRPVLPSPEDPTHLIEFREQDILGAKDRSKITIGCAKYLYNFPEMIKPYLETLLVDEPENVRAIVLEFLSKLRIVIMSMGGGIAFNFNKKGATLSLPHKLGCALGYTPYMVTYVVGGARPKANPTVSNVKAVYTSCDDITRQEVNRRLDNGAWTVPIGGGMRGTANLYDSARKVFIEEVMVPRVSRGNVRFAVPLVQASDETFMLPTVTPTTFTEFPEEMLPKYMPSKVPKSSVFNQSVYLMAAENGNGDQVATKTPNGTIKIFGRPLPMRLHCTLHYDPGDNPVDLATIVNANSRFSGKEWIGAKISVHPKGGKKKKGGIQIIVPLNDRFQQLDGLVGPKTHFTVNPGPHAPVEMGAFAKAVMEQYTAFLASEEPVMMKRRMGRDFVEKKFNLGEFPFHGSKTFTPEEVFAEAIATGFRSLETFQLPLPNNGSSEPTLVVYDPKTIKVTMTSGRFVAAIPV